ncbi:HK97 family phage prohead protease [Mesorhizobium sp. WSM2239]|uniref:HK97 family phage prohead protease n=2 Tax=unclassified Mesorhizobium TaxID=325217 RepID=A0AAU8D5Q9_9HYPH
MTPDLLECEVRFAPPADDGTIEGLAVRFDVLDSYRTTFDRRAFAWDGKRLPLLWSHDRNEVVGSVRAVTMEADGLKVRGKLNLDVQRAREVRAMLIEGDISGLSIGFRRLKDEARAGGIRHITRAELVEVSFVALPSVPGSGVTSVRVHQVETGRASAAAFVAACRKASRSLEKLK